MFPPFLSLSCQSHPLPSLLMTQEQLLLYEHPVTKLFLSRDSGNPPAARNVSKTQRFCFFLMGTAQATEDLEESPLAWLAEFAADAEALYEDACRA